MTPILAGEVRVRTDPAIILGANGPATAIRSGAGAPASGLGVNGDFYIDTTAKALYGPKSAGAWGSAVSLINGPAGPTGPTGPSGRTILSGTGAPSSGAGANGDFYIDTTEWALYGPKAAGAWGSPTSLTGPAGPQGPAGAAAAPAPVGMVAVGGVITPNAADGPGPHRYTAIADVTLAAPVNPVDGSFVEVQVYASGGARLLSFEQVGLPPVTIATGGTWWGRFSYVHARTEWLLED